MDNWVYAKERLPNADGRYLVIRPFMDHYRIEIGRYITRLEMLDEQKFKGRKCGGFFYYDDEWGEYNEQSDVLYWMPLPKMPQYLEVHNDN